MTRHLVNDMASDTTICTGRCKSTYLLICAHMNIYIYSDVYKRHPKTGYQMQSLVSTAKYWLRLTCNQMLTGI